MNYFTFLTPLVAGVIAVYGIFPDVFNKDASSRRKVLAVALILLGVITSIWSAYTAYSDEKYLSSWRAVENIHDGVDKAWDDFQQTIFDSDRLKQGMAALNEAQELIKQGRLAAAEAKSHEVQKLVNFSQPDKQKLGKVADEIHQLMNAADHQGVSYDLRYRTVLFCITLETLARLHSTNPDMSPLLLFEATMKDETSQQTDKFAFTPEWSEFLWSVGFFRPSDFGPPLHILAVDGVGRLIMDQSKFDEAFLMSRASFLLDWLHSSTR